MRIINNVVFFFFVARVIVVGAEAYGVRYVFVDLIASISSSSPSSDHAAAAIPIHN